ncbi:class I SAM-dependent methyltransferase [Clostridium sp. 19966]|uniref:class I SAM-dependent methyltransferase n=1 Tax=Clostridium sp. 19966 TaxID=2768166 RepID=UPI0028DE4DC9|nr:class I SAM-dependent methyltransferase [Clostridium sp. 19966]MDT8719542.1 class I SAM-dependent methyltransferase [Clostridium sp. 19966]
MEKQSETNKEAWSYKAYEFWTNNLGSPAGFAQELKKQPEKHLRRHLEYLGDVKGKKVANLLGSCGKKAIPLALLGADVTIVDISEQNKNYALETAKEAGVNLNYIVSDFLALDLSNMQNSFDIVYLEGGILHYFSDLNELAERIYRLLKLGGKLILNDFHPIRKIFKIRDIFDCREDALELTGDYFEDALQISDVAHEKFFTEKEREKFPKCLLRYWTMGEIITSFATAGFVIEKLTEGPRFDEHKNIPGEFTLIAYKLKIEK